jgi:hypothetical protein
MIHRYHHRRVSASNCPGSAKVSGSFSDEQMNHPGLVNYGEVEDVPKQREGLSKNWPQVGVLDMCSGVASKWVP